MSDPDATPTDADADADATAPQIAVQMYTLRDHCKTAADAGATFEKLRGMGFEAVETCAAVFDTLPAEELKSLLDDSGLRCIATHRSLDQLEDASAEIDYHGILGCRHTSIGGWGFGGEAQKSAWSDFADRFNALAKPYADANLRIGYHNHSHEWIPFGADDAPETISPEDNPISLLRDRLDPAVCFELDTYWIANAGGCPAAWIRAMADRVPLLHVKDLTLSGRQEHRMCEVGAGNLHWPGILEAAKAAGVKHYIIERDDGEIDAFESLKISLENLQKWGVGGR